MARFPDYVAFFDTGVEVPVPGEDGQFHSPGIAVPALVSIHDKAQTGGQQVEDLTDVLGNLQTSIKYKYNTPFQTYFDVFIATSEYEYIRSFFRSHRANPAARQLAGHAGLKIPSQTNDIAPALFTPGRIPQGVYEYPDRQNVLVRPVMLEGFRNPFGPPLDTDRKEQGLEIKYMMPREGLTLLVCERGVNAF